MPKETDRTQDAVSEDEAQVRQLYHNILDQWNRRSAPGMAGLFTQDGNMVGFDGSPVDGQSDIESTLSGIFKDHETGAYVGKVREVRFLAPDVAVLRSVSGMVPPGKSNLNPAVNSIQTLVASRRGGQWRIEVYQNTPAAFHGRPEMSEALTDELRELL